MKRKKKPIVLAELLIMLIFATFGGPAFAEVRVPAEWEPHAAIWMQWPNQWESVLRPAFADIIKVIQKYEPVHVLTSSESAKTKAEQFLRQRDVPSGNITWHVIPVDNAWMRDNGPIYVAAGRETWILDWKFTAWGGNWGHDVGHEKDDRVPSKVARYLGMRLEDRQDYVLERGNLEVNGAGTAVLNWDCQDHRNPGMSRSQHEAILRNALGLTRIIWAYGHDPKDRTTGHIDGIARFVDRATIAIADNGTETERNLAVAAKLAGLKVISYPGDTNWLVGNGFVLAMRSDGVDNAILKSQLESMFPGRNVHLIDAEVIAEAGGGIHCVTNDQPEGYPDSK